MDNLKELRIKARNFKCFGEEAQGFERILPINIIIGKNNSGKSALLQVVEYVVGGTPSLNTLGRMGRTPKLFIGSPLKEDNLKKVFKDGVSGGPITGSHSDYRSRIEVDSIVMRLSDQNTRTFSMEDNEFLMKDIGDSSRIKMGNELVKNVNIPIQGGMFRMVSAERDIKSEVFEPVMENLGKVLFRNGDGATNLINNFLNDNQLSEKKVEKELLGALKYIYGDDADFSRIQTQFDKDTGKYEIYLDEDRKGNRISLSNSGSSLKTILLVLMNTILIPELLNKDLNRYIFAFEELENNLHPSLQRRLLQYLIDFTKKSGCTLFITTHSNVVIDVFSSEDCAQILHVKHDGESALVDTVGTHIEKCGILDDLDFRASDVLQANGVLWVEGPTDRIYLKKWIDLWSNEELKEGIHYQFVFYGGSVRKHLSASDPESVDSAISIFRINKNAVVVMDSDKSKESQKLEESKERLINEMEDLETSMSFVTEGKDIENYISPKVVKSYLKLKSEPRVVGQYEDFGDYLNDLKGGSGKTFENNKVLFADRIKDTFIKEDLSKMYDIDKQMKEIVSLIRGWNKLDKKD